MRISAHALEFNLGRNYDCVNHDEMASRVFLDMVGGGNGYV